MRDKIKFDGFNFEYNCKSDESNYPYITINHTTSGYYGCDSDYDLDKQEVLILRNFLNDWLNEPRTEARDE